MSILILGEHTKQGDEPSGGDTINEVGGCEDRIRDEMKNSCLSPMGGKELWFPIVDVFEKIILLWW